MPRTKQEVPSDDVPMSTSKSSYKVPSEYDFKNEKEVYRTNKAKANKGGDWWCPDPNAAATNRLSNYTASFGEKSIPGAEGNQWLAHRRRKPVAPREVKVYNIITGVDYSSAPKGHDPSKTPKRISSDKLRKAQESKDGRSYNIITNGLQVKE